MAELAYINEIKFWSLKYVILSCLIGINSAFFGYHLLFKNLKVYIGLPLTFITLFETRNIALRNCMDKIYFSIQPIYQKLRKDLETQQQINKIIEKTIIKKEENLPN